MVRVDILCLTLANSFKSHYFFCLSFLTYILTYLPIFLFKCTYHTYKPALNHQSYIMKEDTDTFYRYCSILIFLSRFVGQATVGRARAGAVSEYFLCCSDMIYANNILILHFSPIFCFACHIIWDYTFRIMNIVSH